MCPMIIDVCIVTPYKYNMAAGKFILGWYHLEAPHQNSKKDGLSLI
jgi:hypothetical protein